MQRSFSTKLLAVALAACVVATPFVVMAKEFRVITANLIADNATITNLTNSTGAIPRSALTQQDAVAYPISFTDFRVWDAMQTNLPGTAANDDLAIIGGTFATAGPTLQGVDFGGGTTTAYARVILTLPPEYVAAETVTVRLTSGMLTTVADNAATVDVQLYEVSTTATVGSDLCATAAQSINSLTLANKDFTITATGLLPGDVLDVRLTVTATDAGNLGVMIPTITYAALLLDIKG